jgi:tRNA dimethylallyltransferase
MDIGSGKPSNAQRREVAHYCIDITDPDYRFTAGNYCREADEACNVINSSGKIPLFVGGTGMYIDAFFNGLSNIPPIDNRIKDQLQERLRLEGVKPLYNELVKYDAKWAARIHHNDTQRILRGLEVFMCTGRPISSYHEEKSGNLTDETLYVGLYCDRSELRDRIYNRVDMMMKEGFLEEVEKLRVMGYGPGLKSMKALGYAQLHAYLDGEYSIDEAIIKIKNETARYAKRQLTWFRRNKRIRWFNKNQVEKLREMVYNWIG